MSNVVHIKGDDASPEAIFKRVVESLPIVTNCIVICFDRTAPKGLIRFDYYADHTQLAVAAAYLLRDATTP